MADRVVIYEPQYSNIGWFDNNGLKVVNPVSWFCRDLSDEIPKTLTFLDTVFVDDFDVIYLLDGHRGTPIPQFPPGFDPISGITVQLLAGFFDDPDNYFVPIAIRALKQSDAMLKNEVRRIR